MLPIRKDVELYERTNVQELNTITTENGGNSKKRRLSINNVKNGTRGPESLSTELSLPATKRFKTGGSLDIIEGGNPSMAEPQRKANFSAYGNHFHERSPLANSKPGQAKKLIIKNFKGKSAKPDFFADILTKMHKKVKDLDLNALC